MKLFKILALLCLVGCVAEQKKDLEIIKPPKAKDQRPTFFAIKKDSLFENYMQALDTVTVKYNLPSDSALITSYSGSLREYGYVMTLFIDRIINDSVFGHSITAGNFQTFKGTKSKTDNGISFTLFEEKKSRTDGKFIFTVKDSVLEGEWTAYEKIKLNRFTYYLTEKKFKYDSTQTINEESIYLNTKKTKNDTIKYEVEKGKIENEIITLYASTTSKLHEFNASLQELKEEDLKELKKTDLLILRNTIFARHGFSFRNEQLNYFFSQQLWYMPVSVNVSGVLTELEKKNIALISKFEKYAEEAYDSFGR